MVAPAYIEDSYVDHVLSANLDSTFAFEGPEKLLEVWFWPSPDQIPPGVSRDGLRAVPLEKWVDVLDLVNCKILLMKSLPAVDAYLLSELSLFVFPHKMILKTCGTTTTLACLEQLFTVASEYCHAELRSQAVHRVFYSRRSFMFPDKQQHVHRDWRTEVKFLNLHFVAGKLYVVGDFTSDDHWYLYAGGSGADLDFGDQTFEILMTQLDPARAKAFVAARTPGEASLVHEDQLLDDHDLGHDYGLDTMRKTQLDRVFDPAFAPDLMPLPSSNGELDDFVHDAFSFTPCGYSSNSISARGHYYTLHITPESGWSYASFETNYPFSSSSPVDIVSVLTRVLRIFRPGRFSATFICDVDSGSETRDELAHCDGQLAKLGYVKHERVVYDMKHEYSLLYLNFEKTK